MALTAAQFVTITDKYARIHQALRGSLGLNAGTGQGKVLAPNIADDWGASKAYRELETIILATADSDLILNLLPGISTATIGDVARMNDAIAYSFLWPRLRDLDARCAAAGLTGVTDIRSFATYYNTSVGGPYNALVCSQFSDLYFLCFSGALIGASNIYALAISDMGQKTVAGAFMAGTAVNSSNFAGAARSQITTTGITGTGVVTVTGSARTSAGVVTAGRTFDSANVTGNGTFLLTPTVAGDILVSVSDITIPGGISAGTVVVNGLLPAGRVNPPV